MRMSLEAKEVVKNGKSTSPLSKSEYFTPETSDDDLSMNPLFLTFYLLLYWNYTY